MNNMFETSSEHIITFAGHEYGSVGVLKIKMRSSVRKLELFENWQFSNCSHLIASHCMYVCMYVCVCKCYAVIFNQRMLNI